MIKLQGTGKISTRKDGQFIETITASETIGIYISYPGTEKEVRVPTNIFDIRFSKKGCHIIPKQPKSKKGKMNDLFRNA